MDYYNLLPNVTELNDSSGYVPEETLKSPCEDIIDTDMIISVDNRVYEELFGEFDKTISHYTLIPAWIFIVLLIIGCSGNVINTLVYTRPYMKSPISLLLVSLEVINIFLFATFIPDLIRHFNGDFGTSYSGIIVETYYPAFETAIIGVSNWLTVIVGLWRFIAIKYPLNVEKWCNRLRTKLAILIIVVMNILVSSPQIIQYSFKRDLILNITYNINTTEEYSKLINYYIGVPSRYRCEHPNLESVSKGFILTTTSIPCFFLAIVTILLLISVWEAKKKRKCLTSIKQSADGNNSIPATRQVENHTAKETKLTVLLIILVFLYFLAYLPDSVLNIQTLTMSDTSSLHDTTFYKIIATRINILVCNASTFFIYYVMSERFREALYRIVLASRFKNDLVKKSTLTMHSLSSSKSVSSSAKDVSIEVKL